MRKLLTLFTAFLFVGTMWGTNVTFSKSDFSKSGNAVTATKSGVTVSCTTGNIPSGASSDYVTFTENNTLTISSNEANITAIDFTSPSDDYVGNLTDVTEIKTTSWSITVDNPGNKTTVRVSSIVVTLEDLAPSKTARPVFSLAEQTFYESSLNVELSCSTQGATIHYTTDGSAPTSSSATYSSALSITSTTTVKAIAVKDGLEDSEVASATYTKGEAVEGYNVNFEAGVLVAYVDWEFSNLTIDNTITAHGGTNYAKTNGTTTAAATTKAKVANPGTLTYYISKVGTNTNANSKWKARVSSDGTNWTIVGAENAAGAGVTEGTWNECSADLSEYNNVYVQVYYDGTSAVRTLDDISLTMGAIKYDITISDAIEHGSVTASLAKAAAGVEITLTPSADGGYLFEAWDVKDGENNPITVTNNKFNMPASNVTVSATFVLDECTPLAQPALDGDIALTCTSAVFTWEAVEHAEGYLLSIKQGSTSIVEDEMITDAVTYTATGLDAGTEYSYSLMALGDGNTYCFDNNIALEGNFSTPAQPVAPTFSVAAGTYFKAQSVTITAEGATAIYYTLDGTDPTNASAEYESAITISETKTLKAIAEYAIGMSAIGTANYTILDVDVEGDGTKANPFTVADVYELNNQLSGAGKQWVIGYIVGCADNGGGKADSETNSNIALGSSADQTENLVPVQLPSGAVRTALNIVDNAGNVGKYIKVYGTLESYFGTTGVKNTSDYEILDTPTAIDNTEMDAKAVKVLRNGVLYIEKNGVRYNAMGQIIK